MSNFTAERVRKVRIAQGLSQKDFAAALAISQGVISDIENGRKGPSRNVLLKLSTQFNVNANWLLTGDGSPTITQETGVAGAIGLAMQSMQNVDNAMIQHGYNPNTEQCNFIAEPENKYNPNGMSLSEKVGDNDFLIPILDQKLQQEDFDLFKFSHGNGISIVADKTDNGAMVMLPLYGQRVSAGAGQPANQLPIIEAYMPVLYKLLNGANPKNCGMVPIVGDSMTDINLFDEDIVIFDRTRLEGDGLYVISIAENVRVKRLEYRPFEKKIIISSENAKRYPNPEVITYEQAENLLRIHGKVTGWMHHHPY